jgi:xylose isomerase
LWGGREGLEVEASKNPVESVKRYREAVEFLAHYIRGQGYAMRIAIAPKPKNVAARRHFSGDHRPRAGVHQLAGPRDS